MSLEIPVVACMGVWALVLQNPVEAMQEHFVQVEHSAASHMEEVYFYLHMFAAVTPILEMDELASCHASMCLSACQEP